MQHGQGLLSGAAIVGLLSLFFRRPVPPDVAVLLEVCLDGAVLGPTSRGPSQDEATLRLAKANGIRLLLVAADHGPSLQAAQRDMFRPRFYEQIRVVPVNDMTEVIRTIWGTGDTTAREEDTASD